MHGYLLRPSVRSLSQHTKLLRANSSALKYANFFFLPLSLYLSLSSPHCKVSNFPSRNSQLFFIKLACMSTCKRERTLFMIIVTITITITITHHPSPSSSSSDPTIDGWRVTHGVHAHTQEIPSLPTSRRSIVIIALSNVPALRRWWVCLHCA